jgi:hypothetical protein
MLASIDIPNISSDRQALFLTMVCSEMFDTKSTITFHTICGSKVPRTPVHVPSFETPNITKVCNMKLKTTGMPTFKLSEYIMVALHIKICIYLYIYKYVSLQI